jgi:hypothetical protein
LLLEHYPTRKEGFCLLSFLLFRTHKPWWCRIKYLKRTTSNATINIK